MALFLLVSVCCIAVVNSQGKQLYTCSSYSVIVFLTPLAVLTPLQVTVFYGAEAKFLCRSETFGGCNEDKWFINGSEIDMQNAGPNLTADCILGIPTLVVSGVTEEMTVQCALTSSLSRSAVATLRVQG